MRNAIALLFYGTANALIWIVGLGVSILELLWLVQLAMNGAYVAAFIVFMFGTPIILTIAYWICAVFSMPFLFAAIKLNPELGD
jgi:hypothetical protein